MLLSKEDLLHGFRKEKHSPTGSKEHRSIMPDGQQEFMKMEVEGQPLSAAMQSESAQMSKQVCNKEEEKTEAAQNQALAREVELLSDCVWFTLRLAKQLKYSPDNKYIVQYSLTVLNKYVVVKGLQESLVEQDRFLVAAACFLITTKYTSSHMRSDTLLEFYYLNRPLLQDTNQEPNLASPNNLSSAYVPAGERSRFLKEFSMIKDLIAMEFFKLEFDIISQLNFEVDTLRIAQLPLSMAESVINEIRRHVEKDFQAGSEANSESVQAKKSLLADVCNQWNQICSKVALDSFNRSFALTLPPEILTAIFLYVGEKYLLRLKLFSQNKHTLQVHIQTTSTAGGLSNTDSSKTKAGSFNANSTSDGLRVSPTFTVNSGSTSKGNIHPMTGEQVLNSELSINFDSEHGLLNHYNWLTIINAHLSVQVSIDDIELVANQLLKDGFRGF